MWLRYLFGPLFFAITCWVSFTFHSWNVADAVTEWSFCLQLVLLAFLYIASIFSFKDDRGSRALWIFIAFCLLSRALLAFTPVVLTGDLPRYLWEGSMVRQGVNPYVVSPDSDQLLHYRTEYWPEIEYPHLSAIYPPVSQYLLGLFARGVSSWKLFLLVLETFSLGLILLLLMRRKLPLGRVVFYSALPVSLLEVCGSGHLEGALIFFALIFLWYAAEHETGYKLLGRNWGLTLLSVSMALGFLTKYVLAIPFALFGYLEFRKKNFISLFTLVGLAIFFVGLLFAPFLTQEMSAPFKSLSTYVSHWRYNDSLLHFFGFLSGADFQKLETFVHIKWMLFGLWLLATLTMVAKKSDLVRLTIFSFVLFLLCSAVVHPWYVLWYAPLLCFAPSRAGLWLALTAPFAYLSLFTPSGEVPIWVKFMEYGPVMLFLVSQFRRELRSDSRMPKNTESASFVRK